MFDKISGGWFSFLDSLTFLNSQTVEMRRDMSLTKIILLLLVVKPSAARFRAVSWTKIARKKRKKTRRRRLHIAHDNVGHP
jgi:hypothetical protein